MGNKAKVLIVDDHENLLSGLKRQLRGQYDLSLATSGSEAIEKLGTEGPFEVVVSDMRMPGMDGVELLQILEKKAPDTIRIMLTGNSDQETAVRAINTGQIFRFFNKPCDPETLSEGLDAGIQQFKIHRAEKNLIEQTLSGSIKLLSDILSMSNPHEAHRREKMRRWATKISKKIQIPRSWELDLAVMLSHIGLIGVPSHVSDKAYRLEELTSAESEMIINSPQTGAELIANIPRMENISRAILYQEKHYSGEGFPSDAVSGEDIPLISRVLKILSDLADLTNDKPLSPSIFRTLESRDGVYDLDLLLNIQEVLEAEFSEDGVPPPDAHAEGIEVKDVPVYLLRAGQELLSDVCLKTGQMILARGCVLSEVQVQRIKGMHKITPISENIKVASAVKTQNQN